MATPAVGAYVPGHALCPATPLQEVSVSPMIRLMGELVTP